MKFHLHHTLILNFTRETTWTKFQLPHRHPHPHPHHSTLPSSSSSPPQPPFLSAITTVLLPYWYLLSTEVFHYSDISVSFSSLSLMQRSLFAHFLKLWKKLKSQIIEARNATLNQQVWMGVLIIIIIILIVIVIVIIVGILLLVFVVIRINTKHTQLYFLCLLQYLCKWLLLHLSLKITTLHQQPFCRISHFLPPLLIPNYDTLQVNSPSFKPFFSLWILSVSSGEKKIRFFCRKCKCWSIIRLFITVLYAKAWK